MEDSENVYTKYTPANTFHVTIERRVNRMELDEVDRKAVATIE